MNFENRIRAIFLTFFYTWQLLPVLIKIIILPYRIIGILSLWNQFYACKYCL